MVDPDAKCPDKTNSGTCCCRPKCRDCGFGPHMAVHMSSNGKPFHHKYNPRSIPAVQIPWRQRALEAEARIVELEAALAQQAGAVDAVPYSTLGNWYNLLCHGFMYASEGNAGCANAAIREVLDGLEAIRNAHGPDASFASLASSAPGGGGEVS